MITTSANTVADQIVGRYDQALRDQVDNLATICAACHRIKTDWEHAYYGTGQGNQRKKVVELRQPGLVKLHAFK